MDMIRKPVVAGQFYPDNKIELEDMIEDCFRDNYTVIWRYGIKTRQRVLR